jgi:hypothetical protein
MANDIKRLPLPKSCMCCGSDGAVVMVGRCHPKAGVYPVLTGNILSLECAECRELVTRLEVTCQIKMG